jgi:HEPN domain-containing protein
MRNPRSEARRWLVQGEDDLRFAALGLERGFYAQCCFLCQQAAEKAVKALHYFWWSAAGNRTLLYASRTLLRLSLEQANR